jgi:hypothetical protein
LKCNIKPSSFDINIVYELVRSAPDDNEQQFKATKVPRTGGRANERKAKQVAGESRVFVWSVTTVANNLDAFPV